MTNSSVRLHFALDRTGQNLFTPFPADVWPLAQDLFFKVACRFQEAAILSASGMTTERFISSFLDRPQRLLQIREDVLDILDADGEADQALGDADALALFFA